MFDQVNERRKTMPMEISLASVELSPLIGYMNDEKH